MYSPDEKIHVVGGVLLDQDQILVGQRKSGDSGAGYWEFPGGKVELGESPEQALLREIQEELEIPIRILQLIVTNETRTITGRDIILSLYAAKVLRRDYVLNEHEQVRWVKMEDLKGLNFLPGNRPFLPVVEEFLKNQSKK